jgi:hypothetical protein
MRILFREVVTVFPHAVTLLRHVEDFTIVALPVEEIFAPSNAVANSERITAHIFVDTFTNFLDDADDLMAKNSWAWIGSATFVGMNIRAADRRHGNPHENFAALGRAQRKLL